MGAATRILTECGGGCLLARSPHFFIRSEEQPHGRGVPQRVRRHVLGADRGPVSAFLGWKPIYFLGLISYSIYLWHFPIVQIAKQSFKWIPIGYRNLVVDATTLAAVLLISTLSFYLIERPGRRFLSAPRASMSPA